MRKPVTPGDVDHSIFLARNTIINKIIAAVVISGTIAATVVTWRDIETGLDLRNSLSNFVLLAVLVITWSLRKLLPIQVKSTILFFAFAVITLKSLVIFGPFRSGVLYMSFMCLLIVLSVSFFRSIIYTALVSLIIPVVAFLYFTDHLPIQHDFKSLLDSPSMWFTDYVNFLFTAFILIMGVGQLRKELNKNFMLLRTSITDLEQANQILKKEIEAKEIYQQELKISEEKYKSIFESSSDGVFLLDDEKCLLDANPACLELSGYSLEELRSFDIFSLVSPNHRQIAINKFNQLISGELEGLFETKILRKDGREITVEINSNLILSESGLLILTTVRDISVRKNLEYEKYNAEIKAEERERARFSKDLHDDLGPLLSSVKLYLQSLNNKEKDEVNKAVINKATDIVDTGVKMIREISHNLSPYLLRDKGLKDAIKFHLDKLRDTVQLNTQIEYVNPGSQTLPETKKVVIYRIFLELLNNTLKHSGATEVKLNVAFKENIFSFLYIDNGKGFDADFVNKNFHEGIGLKNIINRINALKGDISFRREEKLMITDIKIPIQ